ncbi:MAG: zinc-ribbon domain-containing protein [Lachnospiraceae bacterium]|nr:zinc-ribbon domain-containing protein [Lachnospiraceae bacterium]
MMKEWNWINNYLLSDPDEILDRYSEPLWWNCPKCGETYLCSPQKRLYYQKRHMESCTYCKGYRRKRRHFI